MGELHVSNAQIDQLASEFAAAAVQVRELLGSLVVPAVAVGPALGSGTSASAYADQWNQIRDAISGAAECLDQYSKAISMASTDYQNADAYVAGHPR